MPSEMWKPQAHSLVKEISRWCLGASTGAVIVDVHRLVGSAVLDLQEAVVQIRFVITAAHGLEFPGTDAGTSLQLESGQAAFQWHNEHMLATVLLSHVALGFVQIVIRSTHEIRRLGIAIRFTVSGQGAVFQGDGNHSKTAGSSLEFAHRGESIAIRSAHRLLLQIGPSAGIPAVLGG